MRVSLVTFDLTGLSPFLIVLWRGSPPILASYLSFDIQIYKIIFRFPNYTIGNPSEEIVIDGSGSEFLATNAATNASCAAPLGCLIITPL